MIVIQFTPTLYLLLSMCVFTLYKHKFPINLEKKGNKNHKHTVVFAITLDRLKFAHLVNIIQAILQVVDESLLMKLMKC